MTPAQKALEDDIRNIREAIYHSKRPNGASASLDRILIAHAAIPEGERELALQSLLFYQEDMVPDHYKEIKSALTAPVQHIPEGAIPHHCSCKFIDDNCIDICCYHTDLEKDYKKALEHIEDLRKELSKINNEKIGFIVKDGTINYNEFYQKPGDIAHIVPEARQGWREIDSAPRDGGSVLLWCKHKTDKNFSIVQGSWFDWQFYADSKEYVIDWEDGLVATHWMPLPSAPALAEREGE